MYSASISNRQPADGLADVIVIIRFKCNGRRRWRRRKCGRWPGYRRQRDQHHFRYQRQWQHVDRQSIRQRARRFRIIRIVRLIRYNGDDSRGRNDGRRGRRPWQQPLQQQVYR